MKRVNVNTKADAVLIAIGLLVIQMGELKMGYLNCYGEVNGQTDRNCTPVSTMLMQVRLTNTSAVISIFKLTLNIFSGL